MDTQPPRPSEERFYIVWAEAARDPLARFLLGAGLTESEWTKVALGPQGFTELPIWFGSHENLTKQNYDAVGIRPLPSIQDLPAVFRVDKDGRCTTKCQVNPDQIVDFIFAQMNEG